MMTTTKIHTRSYFLQVLQSVPLYATMSATALHITKITLPTTRTAANKPKRSYQVLQKFPTFVVSEKWIWHRKSKFNFEFNSIQHIRQIRFCTHACTHTQRTHAPHAPHACSARNARNAHMLHTQRTHAPRATDARSARNARLEFPVACVRECVRACVRACTTESF
jgi:hypothetical protein